MVTPKTASRLSGITVAVGLGVAVTTGHGVASADSTTDGEGVSGPPASAPAETSPPGETKDSGTNASQASAAQHTASQRRAEARAALREQAATLRRNLGDANRDILGGNRQISAAQKNSADVKSEASGVQADLKSNGISVRRLASHVEEPTQIKRVKTEIKQVARRVPIAPTRPQAPAVTSNSVPSVQLSSSRSSVLPSSPVISPVVAPAPVGARRTTTVLSTLFVGTGLRPNATTPAAPRVPALPGLLELAYAAWRRVVVPRVFNSTPTATATVNYIDRDPLTGAVSGAVVGRDADNDRLTYEVVQGPATGTLDFHDDGTFTYEPDQVLAHQPNPADATFTVRVSDEDSRPHLHLLSQTQHSTTATVTIDIEQLNQAPTVTVTKAEPQANGSIRYTVEPTDPDPADRNSLAVTWTDPAKGSVVPVAGTTNVYAYTPDDPHELSAPTKDPFSFIVTDQYGKTGTTTVEPLVQPVNTAPVLTAGTPQKQANGSYTIALSANDADLDSVRVTPPVLDTTLGSWQGLDADGTVTLVPNSTRTITFVPKPVSQSTPVTLQFTADDGHYLGTGTAQTGLTLAPNQAPNFVITNVSAPDATTGAVTITYTKSDPDGDPVTLSATGMDANAKFVDNGNGTATYSPDRGVVGEIGPGGTARTDTFAIVASDGRGGSTSQTVDASVTFTNQKPFVRVIQEATVVDVTTGKIEGQLEAVDLDGDPARFTYAVTDPAAPEASTPGTLDFDLATGKYTFIPKDAVRDAQPGQYRTLVVAVEDQYGGLTNTGIAVLYIVPKVTVVIINPPPNLPGTSGPLPL